MSTSPHEGYPSQDLEAIPFAHERTDKSFAADERVITMFYRNWMDAPSLLDSRIRDINPGSGIESPGFVSVETAKTPDIPSGGIIGIDVDSVALIQLSVLPRLRDEVFRRQWIANGSVSWSGEREMLEEALAEHLDETIQAVAPRSQHATGRTRLHAKSRPRYRGGRVAWITPLDSHFQH